MYWNDWAKAVRELLELHSSPVAVTWSHTGTVGGDGSASMAACQAVFRAACGETVDMTAESCACQGGLVNLGLGEIGADATVRLSDMLVNKAKVYSSAAALQRGQRSVPTPKGAGEHVVFAPLEGAVLQPDLVLVVCDAQQAEQLVSLCSYWDGGPLLVDMAGPMCRNAMAYPMANNRPGLSLLDDGARRRASFTRDQMVLSIPLAQMHLAMTALERGAGHVAHNAV